MGCKEIKAEEVKAFEPLIKKCIKVYLWDMQYYDDAMQEGYIAIIKCMKNYDESFGVRFECYVKRAVIYSIRDFSLKINMKDMSLDEESDGGGRILDFIESKENIEEDWLKSLQIKELKEAIKKLPLKQKEIIYEHYFKGKSLKKISSDKRRHYMGIVALKKRAILNLKEELTKK